MQVLLRQKHKIWALSRNASQFDVVNLPSRRNGTHLSLEGCIGGLRTDSFSRHFQNSQSLAMGAQHPSALAHPDNQQILQVGSLKFIEVRQHSN